MINNILRSRRLGFTLIELLVVIGVLAVIAAGVVALIDPVDKLAQANDSKVQNDIGQIATAEQSYAAQNNGNLTVTSATLVTSGELVVYPTAPSGYAAYTLASTTGACGNACTSVYVAGAVKAKKYFAVGAACNGSATCFWKWESNTGKVCQVGATGTACP